MLLFIDKNSRRPKLSSMTLDYNWYYLKNFQNTCGLQSEQNVNPFLAFCAFFSEFGNFETVARVKEEAF